MTATAAPPTPRAQSPTPSPQESGRPQLSAEGPFAANLVAGVVLEAGNLAVTRAFYEPIFRDAPGEWEQGPRRLTFRGGPQTITFVQRARPRTLSDSGQHQAYRVRRERLGALARELAAAGVQVDWWREDPPAERTPSAYLHDPSGNRVQLMPSEKDGLLLDHVAFEVHEFDYCEVLYRNALGGQLDYYFGWRVEDHAEAKAWATGDDPCAPWTRRDNPNWTDFRDAGQRDTTMRVPRPNTQVFWRYGETRVGLISATKVRQEPPEEIIRGTPRVVLRTTAPAEVAMSHLTATLPIPFQHHGTTAFLRDPDGNFVELRCGE